MKKQKVWLVTGASRGFGKEIVKAALEAGDRVVATVRSNATGLQEQLGNPADLMVVTLDVTREDEVKQGVAAAVAHFGRIDVLVNNAGYGLLGATEEVTDAEARQQFDTNVFGLLNLTRAVLPVMRAQQGGHIINISSLFGYGATVPGLGLYGATKYAVEGITEGLALELAPLGIKVTAVAPGLFSTDFVTADSFRYSATALEAYGATVGKTRGTVAGLHGNQPGDPAKLAAVLIRLAATEQPPLHLPVGTDAWNMLQAKTAAILEEAKAWEPVIKATDHAKV